MANGNDLLVHHYTLYPNYDYFFQLFATSPYLQPESVETCRNVLVNSMEYDSCFTATKYHGFYWISGSPINYLPAWHTST